MKKYFILLGWLATVSLGFGQSSEKRIKEAVTQAMTRTKSPWYCGVFSGEKPLPETDFVKWKNKNQGVYHVESYSRQDVTYAGYRFSSVVHFYFLPVAEYRQKLEQDRRDNERREQEKLAEKERQRLAKIEAERQRQAKIEQERIAEQKRREQYEREEAERKRKEAEKLAAEKAAYLASRPQVAANASRSAFKLGLNLCREIDCYAHDTAGDGYCDVCRHQRILCVTLESWNEDKSRCKVKIISGPEGAYKGEPIKYGSYFWIDPTDGWHVCLAEETAVSQQKDMSKRVDPPPTVSEPSYTTPSYSEPKQTKCLCGNGRCYTCKGSGFTKCDWHDTNRDGKCTRCKNRGGWDCSSCEGRGTCRYCNGKGWY